MKRKALSQPFRFGLESLEDRALPSTSIPLPSGDTEVSNAFVNSRGQVAGTAENFASSSPGGSTQGFYWSPSTGTVAIPNSSTAYGLNDAGQVLAGYSIASGNSYTADLFLWDPTTGAEQSVPLPSGETQILNVFVNSQGQVAGTDEHPISSLSNGYTQAFFWSPSSGTVAIPNSKTAYGLNDAGQVLAGEHVFSSDSYTFDLFLWDPTTGAEQSVPLPSGDRGITNAFVNSQGQVAGTAEYYVSELGDIPQAFFWSPTTGTAAIPNSEMACDLNDAGQVLAAEQIYSGKFNTSGLFLWDPTTGAEQSVPLPSGDTRISNAFVNGQGQVIGTADNVASYSTGFSPQAFFWSPSTGAIAVPNALSAYGLNDSGLVLAPGTVASGNSYTADIFLWSSEQLEVTNQPPATLMAGSTFDVQVSINDADGNIDTHYAGDITIQLANDPNGDSTLSGTLTVPVTNGIADFDDLSINEAGQGFTLEATGSGMTPVTTHAFDVGQVLVVKTQPNESNVPDPLPKGQIASGDTFDVQITVGAGNGNGDASGALTISLSGPGTNPGGGQLSGTLTVQVQNGVADFKDLSISQPGTNYTLTVTDDDNDTVATDPFTVVPDITVKSLSDFNPNDPADPSGANQVYVVYDINTNRLDTPFDIDIFRAPWKQYVDDDTSSQVEVGSLTANNSAQGEYTQEVNFLSGSGDFGLTVEGGGANLAAPLAPAPEFPYVLGVVDPTDDLPTDITTDRGDSQGNFRIYSIAAVAQGFSFTPGLAEWVPQMARALESQGFDSVITVDWASYLGSGPGQVQLAGMQLYEHLVQTAVDLRNVGPNDIIDVQLIGHSRGSAVVDQAIEDLINNAESLSIPQQLEDGYYKLTFLDPHPANQETVGLASFNLSAGSVPSYILAIAGPMAYAYVSNEFNDPALSVPARVNLVEDYYQQNTINNLSAAELLSSPYEAFINLQGEDPGMIQFADLGQTLLDSYNLSSLGLGHSGAWKWYLDDVIPNLFGGGSVPPVPPDYSDSNPSSGTATQIDPLPNLPLGSDGNFDPAESSSFSVDVIALTDQGTVATGYNGTVTLATGTNPSQATLGGTLTVNAVNGIATFSDLTLSNPGIGYTLVASGPGLSSGTSSPIDVEQDQLVVTTEPPSSVNSGSSFPLTVTAETSAGSTDTSFTGDVTLSLYNVTGTLGGEVTEAAVNGVATFAGISISAAGPDLVLSASAPGAALTTTTPITVTAASATQLQAAILPGITITAGEGFTEQVWAEDPNGNVDPTFDGTVTLSLNAHPGNGTLGGTLSATAVDGVATFTGLTISAPGAGYVIQASGDGLSTTADLNISAPGTATQLVATAQPPSVLTPSVTFGLTVSAEDGSGAVDSSYTGDVILSLDNLLGQPVPGLTGTVTEPLVNGQATFTGLSINELGDGYTIQTTLQGLTPTTTRPFSVLLLPTLIDLSSPKIDVGTVSTIISGTLDSDESGRLVPAGETVEVTLDGINQTAKLDSNDTFSATFNTSTIPASATPYLISFTYAGDAEFASATGSSTLTVNTGVPDPAETKVSVSSSTLSSGTTATVTLRAVDANGTDLTSGGATVTFSLLNTTGGQGSFGSVTDNHNGTYTATFTGTTVGTNTVTATINGQTVTSQLPTITVTPGAVDAANSVLTLSSSTLQFGGITTVTLQARDADDNNETTGGLNVSFALANGTGAGGKFSSVTDNHNGTYTATFTGTLDGTNSIVPAINGSPVLTLAQSISVSGAAVSASRSTIKLSSASVASGSVTTITFQAEDSKGNKETGGGLTVAFSLGSTKGGQGTFGSVVDHGNGTYTATFTGTIAGSNTITATIDGTKVTSAASAVKVVPGLVSPAASTVSISSATVKAGTAITVTLQARDAAGNKETAGGQQVLFYLGNGGGTGTFSVVKDNKNGTYTATFTGTLAGTNTVIATINGQAVTSTAPAIAVTPGAAGLAKSVVTLSSGTVMAGGTLTVTLRAVDLDGNPESSGGLAVAFKLGSTKGGQGTFGKVTDNKNGTYTATFTGTIAGSNTIAATIGGKAVTTAAPPVMVTPGAMSLAKSVVLLSTTSVKVGSNITVTLQAVDAYGNKLTEGGLIIAFALANTTGGQGTFGSVNDNHNGTYTATFTGTTTGSNVILASINTQALSSKPAVIKIM